MPTREAWWAQMREKLGVDAVLMQLPVGAGATFEGVVDLVTMKKLTFEGDDGEDIRAEEIPADMQQEAVAARQEMLEALSMYSDTLMELLLAEEEVSERQIHDVVRQAVVAEEFTPVFLGTAYRNKGVQPLLDAIVRYLPSPLDTEVRPKAGRIRIR